MISKIGSIWAVIVWLVEECDHSDGEDMDPVAPFFILFCL
jgi:hypothetical protein